MTVNIIYQSFNEIIFASDRRKRFHAPDKNNIAYAVIYTEDNNKLFHLPSPHNFVAFTFNGENIIPVPDFIEELESGLPRQRLNIFEYSQKLSDLILKKYPVPKPNSRTEIIVGGFDPDHTPKIYKLKSSADFKPEISLLDWDYGGEYSNKAKINFDIGKAKKVELKKRRAKLTADEQKFFEELKAKINDFPFSDMDSGENIEYCRFFIEKTSQDLVKRDRFPMVGEKGDIVRITPEKGVEVKENCAKGNGKTIAETNLHNLELICCGVPLQINLGRVRTTYNGWELYPPNNIHNCPRCGKTEDLSELRQAIEENFNETFRF